MKPTSDEPSEPLAEALFAHARAAQAEWARRPVTDRCRVLRQFRRRLADASRELADAVPRPVEETLTAQILPLSEACRFLETTAPRILAARNLGRRGRPVWLFGVSTRIHREPWGVILIVAPSNYPIFIPGVQALQSLAAGNAVLLKPGTGGHAAAQVLQRLLRESGLPDGLLTVLPESTKAAAAAIALRPDKVILTGSSATGRAIARAAAEQLVPCTLELSGSDPAIVRADADLSLTARALLFGLRLNNGATCIAPRRAFVHREVSHRLESILRSELLQQAPAPICDTQLASVRGLIETARHHGARILSPPQASDTRPHGPLLVAGVLLSSPLLHTDHFAPLLVLVEVDSDTEAVNLASNSRQALGASIFTRDTAAASAMAEQLRAGIVTINDLILPTADPRIPFGGRLASGYGVTRGEEGLLELTQPKVISVRRGTFAPHLDPPHPLDPQLFEAALQVQHASTLLRRLGALARLLRVLLQRPRRRPQTAPPPARGAENVPATHEATSASGGTPTSHSAPSRISLTHT